MDALPQPVAETVPTGPNGDEDDVFGPDKLQYIGNFHKTLPHNEYGEVIPADYVTLKTALPDGVPNPGDIEAVPGRLDAPEQAPLDKNPIGADPITRVATFINPQAGYAEERVGPRPGDIDMPTPPSVLSDSVAAEITELYWMALLRDTSLERLADPAHVETAIDDLAQAFRRGIDDLHDCGHLRPILDLPSDEHGQLRLTPQTLFRCGLREEDKGPLISQFLLHDVPFGTQTIVQKQFPYAPGRDYLIDHPTWLLAQNTGYDRHGRPYSGDNDYRDDPDAYEGRGTVQRRIGTLRDMARFVNKDALHQAYFNAALLLSNWSAKVDPGNPYRNLYKRQGAFGTLGDPNLLALVSEVATRALQVVWRQKWRVNRRLRPEAYAGLMQMQRLGYDRSDGKPPTKRVYGLPDWVFETKAAAAILEQRRERGEKEAYFLPMAFSAGSPAHPSYGAGHASVAGACVTILKAWYDEDAAIAPLIEAATHPQTREKLRVREPKKLACDLPEYGGTDKAEMTVRGELNKLACNVAMGRSMGGVHWRTDNTRSLRLGEKVATIMLKRHIADYSETPVKMTYTSFDNGTVSIEKTGVTVSNDKTLENFYNTF